MFCRNRRGTPRCAHNSMKCAPFWADFAEQDAVVGDDSDRHAVEAREPGNQRRAVARLELVEARAVDEAGDDLAHVVGFAGVLRDDAVEFSGIVERLLARLHGDPHLRHAVEVSDDPARQVDGMGIVLGELVGDARNPCMNVTATEVLGADLLSRRRLYQRGASQENRALVAHDDGLVAHGRHIGPARGARAHHHRHLRDALGRHVRLIEEDTTEMVAVGKHLVLLREKCPARVDEVDAGRRRHPRSPRPDRRGADRTGRCGRSSTA